MSPFRQILAVPPSCFHYTCNSRAYPGTCHVRRQSGSSTPRVLPEFYLVLSITKVGYIVNLFKHINLVQIRQFLTKDTTYFLPFLFKFMFSNHYILHIINFLLLEKFLQTGNCKKIFLNIFITIANYK